MKPCDDLDRDLRDNIIERGWNSGKRKYETIETENLFIVNKLWKMSPLLRRSKNKNYLMLILHQFKLMTRSGFGILLILVEGFKRDIA